jgi:hypothetical protein
MHTSDGVNIPLCSPTHQLILTDVVLFLQRKMVNVNRVGCPANQDMNVINRNLNVWQNVSTVYILQVRNLTIYNTEVEEVLLCLDLKILNLKQCHF